MHLVASYLWTNTAECNKPSEENIYKKERDRHQLIQLSFYINDFCSHMLGHIGSVTCRAALSWSCSLQVLPTSITLPVSCSVSESRGLFLDDWIFFHSFGEDQHTCLNILKQQERKASLMVSNSSFLNSLLRDTKIWPKTAQSCLLVSYCPPSTPLGSHSVGEHLPTKIFSCMNVSHVLGGFSAGWKCLFPHLLS